MAGRSRRDESVRDETYCSSCGEPVSPTANYCTSCGAARDDDASGSAERRDDRGGRSRLDDRRALEARVAAALESGWEVEKDLGDHVVLVRRDLGGLGMHVLVALFTFWWTMGFGNALYACYRYLGKAERTVVHGDGTAPAGERVEDVSSGWSPLSVALRWFVGAAFVGAGTSISTTALAVATVAFGLAVALSGVKRLPPVRRRLEARTSIRANGRRRTVSERSVTEAETPCSSCAGPVERGVERTFRDAYYVLGVPVSTSVSGRNVYCRACANGEVPRRSDATTGRETRRNATGTRERRRGAAETNDGRRDGDAAGRAGTDDDSGERRGGADAGSRRDAERRCDDRDEASRWTEPEPD